MKQGTSSEAPVTVGRSPRRVSYAVAGQAHRETVARAGSQGEPLNRAEWRVLSAVCALLASWSKISDYATLEQIGKQCGMSHRGKIAGALRTLQERGLIEYEPGRGRGPNGGYPSWIAFVSSEQVGAAQDEYGNVAELRVDCSDPHHGAILDDEGNLEPCPTCGGLGGDDR